GRYRGPRGVDLRAMPRHGSRDLHERDARRRLPDAGTTAESPGAGQIYSLGAQATGDAANAERAAAAAGVTSGYPGTNVFHVLMLAAPGRVIFCIHTSASPVAS